MCLISQGDEKEHPCYLDTCIGRSSSCTWLTVDCIEHSSRSPLLIDILLDNINAGGNW